MNAEEINVKIAELCGYKDVRMEEMKYVDYDARSVSEWTELRGTKNGKRLSVPSYASSLDAIMPCIRKDPQNWTIFVEVARLVDSRYPAATATAKQWCLAFLAVKGIIPPASGV
jgi:hypothetical protein